MNYALLVLTVQTTMCSQIFPYHLSQGVLTIVGASQCLEGEHQCLE